MDYLLDLCIELEEPPQGKAPEVVASIGVSCYQLGIQYRGDMLTDPLTLREREDLHWYLEEYWKWPYEQFLQRARRIEGQFASLGKRLYQSAFGSPGARDVLQAWRLHPETPGLQRRISIVSGIPSVLSIPWELLHDEQGFLVLRSRSPVSLVRRLPQQELAKFSTPFEPPLRILLVTARPEEAKFIDPRSIARELLDELHMQEDAGSIALEFLRPPTLPALRSRLSDPTQPAIQVLHFDGHGAFDKENRQGMLAFEDEQGQLALAKADEVAQVLQDSGVRLAVLTACQSALGGGDDAYSSVATQLIRSGVDAVSAMSASVLVVSATRYAEAFYRALASGISAPVAQERARQALHDDPRRDVHRRRADDEGSLVTLHDWWLPHYYQQRPVSLQPVRPARRRKGSAKTTWPRLSESIPTGPRYGFTGRARELLQIERFLLHNKLVVISGFGGMGKTALAREAADWLTRTKLYTGACFVSFEHGGDTATLLSVLGTYLGVYDGYYKPDEPKSALGHLSTVLKKKPVLVIADNLESILPGGDVPLEPEARTALWDTLLNLAKIGTGVLITSRNPALGDGRLAPGTRTAHLPLRGLGANDAYALASRLLIDLGIDRARAPYADLCDLLAQLDHHPLAIQLVLPTLRDHPLSTIRAEFTKLLPTFVDDSESGRNRSLLASFDYSLRRLSAEQRDLLPLLSTFEGGANEADLLFITGIPEAAWISLRSALERAALLTAEQIHADIETPFLHFHPVLVPFLRTQLGSQDTSLHKRYARRYHALANELYNQDFVHPAAARALVWRELPNLRHALGLLLQEGKVDQASDLTSSIASFLSKFGLTRERDQIQQSVMKAAAKQSTKGVGLSYADIRRESSIASNERDKGNLRAAIARLTSLLELIEAQPEGAETWYGSYEHAGVLHDLAKCLESSGQYEVAESRLREALRILPEKSSHSNAHAQMLADLGSMLQRQGRHAQAKSLYDQALTLFESNKDRQGQAITLSRLGTLAQIGGDMISARSAYKQGLSLFAELSDPEKEADFWHKLGQVARLLGEGELKQEEFAEAERCFRQSLALEEQLGHIAKAARLRYDLATVALSMGRLAEAEGWYRGAVERIEQVDANGFSHALFLGELASLIVSLVSAHGAPETRLSEARRYAEQARLIMEPLDKEAQNWQTFGALAEIAELEGKPAQARDYRRQMREVYAAHSDTRYLIEKNLGQHIALTALAVFDVNGQTAMEKPLSTLEAGGWHILPAVRRIWAGERDWHALVEGLDMPTALFILMILEMLEGRRLY